MLSPITSSRMFLFVVMLGLCFFSKESSQLSLERPKLFGPSVALVGEVEDFYCDLQIYPKNEQILLQLFKEGNRTKLLSEYASLDGQVGTFPLVIKPYHEGNLECVARAQDNSDIEPTVSNKHYLRVIEPVAGAEIVHSGPVEFFEGRELKLRCELKAGNHVSYKWLLNDRPVARSPHHQVADNRLSINRTTSADSGSYICIAANQYNKTEVYSSTSPEVVITVKGQLSLERPELFGPSVALVGEVEVFHCDLQIYPKNEQILLQLFKEGNRTKLLSEYTSLDGQVGTFFLIIQPYHEGNLECVARAQDNSDIEPTVSNKHYLRVIEPVAGAEIVHSGPVEFFEGRELKLRCELKAGNHVSYKWLLNDRPVARSPHHHVADNRLSINRTTSADSGSYICIAANQYNKTEVYSSTSPEVVITVKGQLSLEWPELFGPSVALVGEVEVFHCDLQIYPKNEQILLQLFKEGNRTKLLSEYASLDGQVGTFFLIIKPYHEGNLECVARAQDNSDIEPTVSNKHYLRVIEPVEGAEIVHSGPLEFFEGRELKLRCELKAGNHVSYKWLLNDRPVARSPHHHIADNRLSINRTTSADSGSYICIAANQYNKTMVYSSSSPEVVITVKEITG